MKLFLQRILILLYLIITLFILISAIVYPYALTFDDGPPLWGCWIVYPLAIIIMASQSQPLNKYYKLL